MKKLGAVTEYILTMALCLNVTGLLIGLLAAVLMFYYPPRIMLYTEKGEAIITWTSNVTDEGKRQGKRQLWWSKAAPWFLALSFLLQLIALLLPTT